MKKLMTIAVFAMITASMQAQSAVNTRLGGGSVLYAPRSAPASPSWLQGFVDAMGEMMKYDLHIHPQQVAAPVAAQPSTTTHRGAEHNR